MKFVCTLFILIELFSGIKSYGYSLEDTSRIVTQKFTGSVASSFTNSANWKGATFNCLSFALDMDFNRMKSTEKSTFLFEFNSELGFTKFIDSLWNKYADKLNCNYVWKYKQRKIDHSCSVSLTAQLLKSYNYSFNASVNSTQSEWTGSFFNPAIIDAGYGFAFAFWDKSVFNFSIASVRIKSEPIRNTVTVVEKNVIAKINRGIVLFDYGLSSKVLTTKDFNNNFSLNSNARFFMKGFDRESFEMDISNKLNYKVWKWFQLRADLKVIYDPLISYKMQYRNELLFGVFYESDKKSSLKITQ